MSKRHFYLAAFLVVNFILASYFIDGRPASAAVTRAAPALSLALEGTWKIDRYQEITVDKALIDGHYYLDKAPLASFVLTPFVYLVSKIKTFNLENRLDNLTNAIGLGSIVTGSIPFVLILLIFTLTLEKNIGNLFFSGFYSMLLCYGSNLFAYSGALWGHMLTTLFLLLSLILFGRKQFLVAGISMGLAVMAEYQTAIWAIVMVVFLLKDKKINELIPLAMGGLVPLLMILSYHYAFTGHPLKPLYMFEANEQFQQMNHDLGFSLPRPEIFWALIFGLKRGLLFYSPILFLPLYIAIKEQKIELKNISFIGSFLFILLISSFFIWDGGYSHGPRYLVPVTALALFASLKFTPKFNEYKITTLILFSIGFVSNWVAKATHPIYGPEYEFPFRDYLWPLFISGDLTQSNLPNLLLRVFKNGFSYLFPMVFILSILALYLIHQKHTIKTK